MDECLAHTCGRDCNQTINCGWSTVQMQCISGAHTSQAELNMGDCMVTHPLLPTPNLARIVGSAKLSTLSIVPF